MKQFLLFILIVFLGSCSSNNASTSINAFIKNADSALKYSVEAFSQAKTNDLVSPRTAENNSIVMVKPQDWTSGFFPGELWIMYELTGNDYWKAKATDFTLPLENEKWNGKTHDMGFKMFCSYGKAWKNTNEQAYQSILIQSAKTLATRFNPTVGCIRSWDHNADKWDYPVIIDNMMNLELLFWAARETGNQLYRNIAITHAETTMKNHFRDDYSCYHVVDYNPANGEVENKNTHQGYSHESAWSRGQAWALYGYAMVFRETGMKKFLLHAEKIAAYFLNHPNLPEHKIPYWDFDAPQLPNEPYDASAGAIAASALYELSTLSANGDLYQKAADQMLKTLLSPDFLADTKNNHGFLLKHSTGSKPHQSEIDVPLVYADYYLLEAIQRKIKLSE
ncbi:glucuronyl hydrolase [Mangrovibacterium sp.]|uniref:glucuronyl hydrolase n=1 Tax=Mangrovibacterium sp. TaxID=1961364 RepID=UPI0035662FF1